MAVAWTSARAQRCGFYFDPAKLRASYLAYEARQSPPGQLANVEKTYDTTFKSIRERVGQDRGVEASGDGREDPAPRRSRSDECLLDALEQP